MELNEITNEIIGCGIRVHKELGPGLLESSYETCLEYELTNKGLDVERQKKQLIRYRGIDIDAKYYLDLVVEEKVVVEVKSVKALLPIHEAQLLTYLRLSKKKLGLLINFNVTLLRDGIRRKIN